MSPSSARRDDRRPDPCRLKSWDLLWAKLLQSPSIEQASEPHTPEDDKTKTRQTGQG